MGSRPRAKLSRETNTNHDMSDIEHEYTSDPVCPHCGHKHRDAWEWDSDGSGQTECGECEKPFFWERIVTIEYTTSKLPNQP